MIECILAPNQIATKTPSHGGSLGGFGFEGEFTSLGGTLGRTNGVAVCWFVGGSTQKYTRRPYTLKKEGWQKMMFRLPVASCLSLIVDSEIYIYKNIHTQGICVRVWVWLGWGYPSQLPNKQNKHMFSQKTATVSPGSLSNSEKLLLSDSDSDLNSLISSWRVVSINLPFQESCNTPLEHTPGNPPSQLWKESLIARW